MNHARQRQVLNELKVETQARIRRLTQDVGARESIGELSMYDNHPADVGTETFERARDVGSRVYEVRRLEQIDHALERIDSGEYAKCEHCGHRIDDERLEAVPWATRCSRCQQSLDESGTKWRPVEEDVIKMPFGNSDRATEYLGYDGQDAWEDASQQSSSDSPQDRSGEDVHADRRRSVN